MNTTDAMKILNADKRRLDALVQATEHVTALTKGAATIEKLGQQASEASQKVIDAQRQLDTLTQQIGIKNGELSNVGKKIQETTNECQAVHAEKMKGFSDAEAAASKRHGEAMQSRKAELDDLHAKIADARRQLNAIRATVGAG